MEIMCVCREGRFASLIPLKWRRAHCRTGASTLASESCPSDPSVSPSNWVKGRTSTQQAPSKMSDTPLQPAPPPAGPWGGGWRKGRASEAVRERKTIICGALTLFCSLTGGWMLGCRSWRSLGRSHGCQHHSSVAAAFYPSHCSLVLCRLMLPPL